MHESLSRKRQNTDGNARIMVAEEKVAAARREAEPGKQAEVKGKNKEEDVGGEREAED